MQLSHSTSMKHVKGWRTHVLYTLAQPTHQLYTAQQLLTFLWLADASAGFH